MTREEAKKRLEVRLICANCPEDKMCYDSHLHSICEYTDYCDEVPIEEAVKVAIEALEQEPCDDAISRQAVLKIIDGWYEQNRDTDNIEDLIVLITYMDSVNPQKPKTVHCKDCKHFEYNSVAKVDGVPLIVAHEICSRWGDGCKTNENGYCFLFEPKESEDKA